MKQGTVKWFNDGRGFGFIKDDDEGRDHFVHYSRIDMVGHKTLMEGEKVRFDVENGPKGLSAVNVRKL